MATQPYDKVPADIVKMFLDQAVLNPETGCLLMPSDTTSPTPEGTPGYSHLRCKPAGGKSGTFAAHVLKWIAAGHPMPKPGQDVDHTCSVKNCVNIAHLEEVPHAINIKRAWERGRVWRSHRRLTLELARLIRAARTAGKKLKDIAAAYGVSVTHVCNITKGRRFPEPALAALAA